jgi:hypothetical protein
MACGTACHLAMIRFLEWERTDGSSQAGKDVRLIKQIDLSAHSYTLVDGTRSKELLGRDVAAKDLAPVWFELVQQDSHASQHDQYEKADEEFKSAHRTSSCFGRIGLEDEEYNHDVERREETASVDGNCRTHQVNGNS